MKRSTLLLSLFALAGCIPGFASKDKITGTTSSASSSSSGTGGAPLPPSCSDGVKNGDESDVDCGGSCLGCALGKACTKLIDCLNNAPGSGVACTDGICIAPVKPSWTQRNTGSPPPVSPGERGYLRFVYDTVLHESLLWGGTDGSFNVDDPLWGWDGIQWQYIPLSDKAPPSTFNAAFAYDPNVQRAVLFGGWGKMGLVANKTYEWDGEAFGEIPSTNNPPTRYNVGVAMDVAHDQMLVFGGVIPSGTLVDETWLFDTKTLAWTQAMPMHKPTATYGPVAAYDEARKQVVLVGGADINGHAVDQTWLWDGTDWTNVPSTGTPCANRLNQGMAFDRRRNRLVLFGGVPDAGIDQTTCEWDGKAWSVIDVPPPLPPGRNGPGMVFDPLRGSTFVTGGKTGMDIWEYNVLANACKSDSECDYPGHCVDGLCCGSAKCGTCEACNVDPMHAGTCAPVAKGLRDPDSCQGTCDGSGNCVP